MAEPVIWVCTSTSLHAEQLILCSSYFPPSNCQAIELEFCMQARFLLVGVTSV